VSGAFEHLLRYAADDARNVLELQRAHDRALRWRAARGIFAALLALGAV
jgi:hypothetical protein